MNKSLKVYKPNKDIKKGSAIQFIPGTHYRHKTPLIYINAVNQSKDKPPQGSTESAFEWADKIVMMLDTDALGDLGAYIRRLDDRPELAFVHESDMDGETVYKTFRFKRPITDTEKKYGNWNCSLSVAKKSDKSSLGQVNIFLSAGHVYQLLNLIDGTLERYFFENKTINKNRQAANQEAF